MLGLSEKGFRAARVKRCWGEQLRTLKTAEKKKISKTHERYFKNNQRETV